MTWENIKDRILILGEDDYVFADMFMSAISNYAKIRDTEDLRMYTYIMLLELMDENLVKIFLVNTDKNGILIPTVYIYTDKNSKKELLRLIDNEWKNISYQLPLPNQLFWVTADLSAE